jgi:hypothetical protein
MRPVRAGYYRDHVSFNRFMFKIQVFASAYLAYFRNTFRQITSAYQMYQLLILDGSSSKRISQ